MLGLPSYHAYAESQHPAARRLETAGASVASQCPLLNDHDANRWRMDCHCLLLQPQCTPPCSPASEPSTPGSLSVCSAPSCFCKYCFFCLQLSPRHSCVTSLKPFHPGTLRKASGLRERRYLLRRAAGG